MIINVCNGNTKAKLAKGIVPIVPTKKASAIVAELIKRTAIKLGVANFHKTFSIGPSKNNCVWGVVTISN
jgi:hypothetical protein